MQLPSCGYVVHVVHAASAVDAYIYPSSRLGGQLLLALRVVGMIKLSMYLIVT